MSQVFISYAREDRSRAQMVAESLERAGFSVFWDRKVPIGQPWNRFIGGALDNAACVVVLWSHASVNSQWVFEEARRAEGRLIPAMIEPIQPPLGLGLLQAADLTEWRGEDSNPGFAGLVAAISALVAVAGANVAPAANRPVKSRAPAMSQPIFQHLCGVALLKEYKYFHMDLTQREWYFLKDRGFIQPRPPHQHWELEFDERNHGANIAAIAEPTETGWLEIKQCKPYIPSSFLRDRENLKVDPSDL